VELLRKRSGKFGELLVMAGACELAERLLHGRRDDDLTAPLGTR